jgi:16S rRNA (cytidine1402-2'-O)-methyltransferase
VLPAATIEVARRLDCLIAEDARSARAFLKALPSLHAVQAVGIRELNEHTPEADLPALLEPLLAGRDVGLVSEAGCPAVADPGGALVALAHTRGIRVVPLVGPNAMILALMAGGLNGQRFAFVGYVPAAEALRERRLQELERRSAREDETILAIETPYRADALLASMLKVMRPDTRLSVACAVTQPAEQILSGTIAQLRARQPVLGKVPAVFSFLAAGLVDRRTTERPARGASPSRPGPRTGPRRSA